MPRVAINHASTRESPLDWQAAAPTLNIGKFKVERTAVIAELTVRNRFYWEADSVARQESSRRRD